MKGRAKPQSTAGVRFEPGARRHRTQQSLGIDVLQGLKLRSAELHRASGVDVFRVLEVLSSLWQELKKGIYFRHFTVVNHGRGFLLSVFCCKVPTSIELLGDLHMNTKKLTKAIREYLQGERTLFQQGSWHLNQGFTVFPVKKDEVKLYRPNDGTIFREVGEAEARELSASEYCGNKEAITAFLDGVSAIRNKPRVPLTPTKGNPSPKLRL